MSFTPPDDPAAKRALRYGRMSREGHGRWRGWDEAVADRITLAVMKGAVLRRLLAGDAALPCLAVVARWRREHPEWDGALRMAMRTGRLVREREASLARVTPEVIAAIGLRMIEGESLRSLAAEPWTPCARTLYKWVAISPAFAREVAGAGDFRDMMLGEQIVEISDRNGPFGLEATKAEAWPLQLRRNQLSKRPGWKRRRDARAE
jgi:hypothetical protein